MAEGKGGSKLKGLDVLIGMGPPPKLGGRTGASGGPPRSMSAKSYRGSAELGSGDGDGDTDPSAPAPDDENAFDKQEEAPDEMLVGAAHDVLAAFHSRDAEGVAAALKAFITMV